MAKITLTICDVKPCNNIAERDFKLNGHTIHVCGEGCFAKYWSREYQSWKQAPYNLNASYADIQETYNSGQVLKVLSSNK